MAAGTAAVVREGSVSLCRRGCGEVTEGRNRNTRPLVDCVVWGASIHHLRKLEPREKWRGASSGPGGERSGDLGFHPCEAWGPSPEPQLDLQNQGDDT